MPVKTLRIIVTGRIQGVGFRPFVYRIAIGNGITGWVQNTNENVRIMATGSDDSLRSFIFSLQHEHPPAAVLDEVTTLEVQPEEFPEFAIRRSDDVSDDVTEISPDIAVCHECLEDMDRAGNRKDYPFVNCTNCGPRFTIIRDLPYDRPKTTMDRFPMCSDCGKEYDDVADRRFHAQPTACNVCGPQYEWFSGLAAGPGNGGEPVAPSGPLKEGFEAARLTHDTPGRESPGMIAALSDCIGQGGVVLIKGLGGMHLACDAFNNQAVDRLRRLKNRDGKPFALMFRDLEAVRQFAFVNPAEEHALTSWRRPIVLLALRNEAKASLPPGVNSALRHLGVMLPYMPFHHQLFMKLRTPAIVLTSGNFSQEPILIDNHKAIEGFGGLTDAIILHNRDIHNRTDDSVVKVMAGRERLFRRSRGYVPEPVRTKLNTEGIVAFGAELTNCFCVGKGRKAFLSQHIGDLKGLETTLFYEQTLARFIQLFRVKPQLLAVDLHPDYISTKTAEQHGGLPKIAVQHHHAHIASCMAEYGLDERVIGVAFDGTGFGDDGNTWGSEFLVCDLAGYERKAHLAYLPAPGGDSASEEPWRMAISWLYQVYGSDFINLGLPVLHQTDPEQVSMLTRMIDRKINSPLTCGAGRYFDAVSSVIGLCQVATFQAEGPMRLETLVQPGCHESYDHDYIDLRSPGIITLDKTLQGIVNDLHEGVALNVIAARFHNTIISVIFETAKAIRKSEGIDKVVLSGGVFQNQYLLENTIIRLTEDNFEVFSPAAIPANDGGIALGQMAVAAKLRALSRI